MSLALIILLLLLISIEMISLTIQTLGKGDLKLYILKGPLDLLIRGTMLSGGHWATT